MARVLGLSVKDRVSGVDMMDRLCELAARRGYALDGNRPQSIGKLQAFWGNFGMLVRAYAYAQREWMMRDSWGAMLVHTLSSLEEAVA